MALKKCLCALFLFAPLLACTAGAGAPAPEPVPAAPRFPPITRGSLTPNEEVAAARLMAEARDAMARADYGRAAVAADELAEGYPNAAGSSEALWIVGQASIAFGEHERAAAALEDLLQVLDDTHPARAEVRALQAEALYRGDDMAGAAAALMALPGDAVSEQVAERFATAVSRLDGAELEALAAGAGPSPEDPRLGPLWAELALAKALAGDEEEARELAARAGAMGIGGRAEAVANAVLAGDVSAFLPAAPIIGAVLPVSGSPSNQEYTELFLEGVEVALETARQDGLSVEFVVEDNRGTNSGSQRALSALQSRGAVAVLGPLLEENLVAASQVREGLLALLSPTARRLPGDLAAVYSMAMVDPGAARSLAEAVSELGFYDAVVIHRDTPPETEEALMFEEVFMSAGGHVRRRISYAPGTTYFEEPMLQVETLLPQLLVLPVPADELELLAPQVAFFGLDTLDIQVAGTAGWTAPSVLQAVAQRHTDRVIAVSSSPPGSSSDLAAVFVEAYESRFRKTLRSLVPAVGFDMFRMALAAYGRGVRTPGDLVAALESLRRFEGVTGTYSVTDGRIVREFFPVKIYQGSLVTIDTELPELVRPGRPPSRIRNR